MRDDVLLGDDEHARNVHAGHPGADGMDGDVSRGKRYEAFNRYSRDIVIDCCERAVGTTNRTSSSAPDIAAVLTSPSDAQSQGVDTHSPSNA